MDQNVRKNALLILIIPLFLVAGCGSDQKENTSYRNEEQLVIKNNKDSFSEDGLVSKQEPLSPENDCTKTGFRANPQLLVKTMYPGFTPGGVKGELDRIVILTSGKVMRGHRDSYNAPWRDQFAGELKQDELSSLKKKLCDLVPGKIEFPDDDPVTDGPSTHYEAQDGKGTIIAFLEYSGGRWGKLESFQWTEELRALIDSFK